MTVLIRITEDFMLQMQDIIVSTEPIYIPEDVDSNVKNLTMLTAIDEDLRDSFTWALSGEDATYFGVTKTGILYKQEGRFWNAIFFSSFFNEITYTLYHT